MEHNVIWSALMCINHHGHAKISNMARKFRRVGGGGGGGGGGSPDNFLAASTYFIGGRTEGFNCFSGKYLCQLCYS